MTFDQVRKSEKRVTCKHEKLLRKSRYDFTVYRYLNDYLEHICHSSSSEVVNEVLDCDLWEIEPNWNDINNR